VDSLSSGVRDDRYPDPWLSMAIQRAQPPRGVQFNPDQPVLHRNRRATLIRVSNGMAIIRYRGDSHAVSVPLDSLSLPTPKRR
jgi:hypothetical protein